MSKELTEAQFSMQCSFIAKNAVAWAGDILTLPEHYDRPSDPKTVARFTDDIRGRLDRLDEWAGRKTMSGWQPIGTAPKDGTQILLGGLHANHGWLSKSARYWIGAWWANGDKVLNPVTHWMPIPSPPEKIESGANAAADSSALASRDHEEAATEGNFNDVTE